MSRTLLELAQDVCDELGLTRPTLFVNSSDQQQRQLLAFFQREGDELSKREGPNQGWQQLRKEHTITIVSGQANYDVPADFVYYINDTQWDRTNKWQLIGPMDPQEWQTLKSGITPTGPRRRFRVMDNQVYIDPTPDSSGDTLVIEYYSNGWCTDSGGTVQSRWAADTDLAVLPENLFVLGVKWRFRAANGLDASAEYEQYENAVNRELGRSAMGRTLHLDRKYRDVTLISDSNIPDIGYGS